MNFFTGKLILAKRKSGVKWPLVAGLVFNLGLIGYFKYFVFFATSVTSLAGQNVALEAIVLPLGISFFTFQQIAYLVDCHQGKIGDTAFSSYALFVCFFPQLIAGPIVHHKKVVGQFNSKRLLEFCPENLSLGISLFVIGLFKKVVIADTLSPFAGSVFDGTGELQAAEAWIGALAYTFQIYFDFSGYSDMAIGIGRMFNIELPLNFDSPYKATSIVDFWRRWHITLSAFLKDYLYIPLGGNRKGTARRYVNLMLTMLLGGLWHGAGWTFVVWGGLHGLYLCLNHLFAKISKALRIPASPMLGWALTFLGVVLAWVLFRAPSFTRAMDILKGMIGENGLWADSAKYLDWNFDKAVWHLHMDERIVVIAICAGIALGMKNGWRWLKDSEWATSLAWAFAVAAMFVCAVMSMTRISEFLYFQF